MIEHIDIVQGSRQAYICVAETREKINVFYLITNSNVNKYSLDEKFGKK